MRDIELRLNSGENIFANVASKEELLAGLRDKIKEDPPFEVKREIAKTLVKEIIVHTRHDNDGIKRPKANVTVRYNLTKGIVHTGARVVNISPYPVKKPGRGLKIYLQLHLHADTSSDAGYLFFLSVSM
ncbi:hypothetical protein [Desulfocucumis palustris]|uniref:hypothetical protein n=1 Tax=Desulfocucumis palustris TaxID=1898651 RepID=UPI000FFE6824|nr:hypothetical protein [Desulfocucumis palustris]